MKRAEASLGGYFSFLSHFARAFYRAAAIRKCMCLVRATYVLYPAGGGAVRHDDVSDDKKNENRRKGLCCSVGSHAFAREVGPH